MSIYDIKNLINSWLYYLETDSLDPNTRELLIRRLLEVGISPFSSTSMNFSYMEPLNSSVLHVFDKNNNLKGVKIAPDIGSDFNIIDIKFVENPLASGWRMGGGATAPCNTKQSGDGPSTPIYSGGGAEAGSCLAASPPRRLAASPPRLCPHPSLLLHNLLQYLYIHSLILPQLLQLLLLQKLVVFLYQMNLITLIIFNFIFNYQGRRVAGAPPALDPAPPRNRTRS